MSVCEGWPFEFLMGNPPQFASVAARWDTPVLETPERGSVDLLMAEMPVCETTD